MAMKALMHLAQVRIGNVSIHLGRGDIAVAEHGLYATEVGTIHQ